MAVQPIESLQEFKELIASEDKIVFIDFWATWCGPCRTISPLYEKFAEQFGSDKVIFRKVDMDAREDIGMELNIRAMPTFMAFRNGEKLGEVVGAIPAQLEELITTNSKL